MFQKEEQWKTLNIVVEKFEENPLFYSQQGVVYEKLLYYAFLKKSHPFRKVTTLQKGLNLFGKVIILWKSYNPSGK